MKRLILLIFLSSCSSETSNFKNYNEKFDFENVTSFDKFKKKLEIYSEKNPYPDIDSN
jgi:hypothetical protein